MNQKSLFSAFLLLGLITCCLDNQSEIQFIDSNICACNSGYYGNLNRGDQCQQCPQGTTSSTPSSSDPNFDVDSCSICQQNYFMQSQAISPPKRFLLTATAAVCIQCPSGSGNANGPTSVGDETQCNQCQANYYMTAQVSKSKAAQCSPCPANSFSNASTSVGFCTCFDSNAIPLSSSQTTCACPNGYVGKVATAKGQSGCQKCGQNQFISGNTCVTCADGSTVNKDLTGCTCNDSSDGTIPWSLTTNVCQCKQNYYGTPDKAAQGQQGSCKPCAQGTSSNAGSKTADQCTSTTTKPPSDNTNTNSKSEIINISIFVILILTVFY
ncbi:hypothetical protein ABPG74_007577 [Tetrahymena malaccensis]